MYKHIFGPVPSRRLGKSLGIDMVTSKSCNLNCIFCECGATKEYTISRQSFKDVKEIEEEILSALKEVKADYITFSGSGEPTLSKDIGRVINFIKKHSSCKVAVITNSTLLYMDDVIEDLQNVDLIIPTINTTEESIFEKIVRPSKYENVANVMKGLQKLSKSDFKGTIYLETFILENINDGKEDLKKLAEFLKTIKYDKLQLNTLARPGAVRNLKSLPYDKMLDIKKFLEQCGLHDVEIIKDYQEEKIKIKIEKNKELIENMKSKRPYTKEELEKLYKS